jgi:hypothetical protein
VAMTPHKSTRSVSRPQQRKRNYLAQRRAVLRTIQKYIVHHIDDICRVRRAILANRGRALGRSIRREKIRCIVAWGELWLEPIDVPRVPCSCTRKPWLNTCPWYFGADCALELSLHNVMNHIISGIFAGNAVVGRYRNIRRRRRILERLCKRPCVSGHNPIWCRLLRVTEMQEPSRIP